VVKQRTSVAGPSIAFGDKVAVPIGTTEVIGTVLEVYGPTRTPHVLVEVGILGSTGETLDKKTTSYPLSAVRTLTSMTVEELGSFLRRYRPVAAAVQPGQKPPVWLWEHFEDVRAELKRRHLSDAALDELVWG
jgi:hypothetical protein